MTFILIYEDLNGLPSRWKQNTIGTMLLEKLMEEVACHERLAILGTKILDFPAHHEWYRKKGFKPLDEVGIHLGKYLTPCFY